MSTPEIKLPFYFYWWRKFRKHFGFKWGEWLGRPECPYLRRWAFNVGLFSIRVHHFMRSDDARAHHDHPWWFLTLVLRGAYYDISQGPEGEVIDHLTPGSIRFRPALHRHTVVVDRQACAAGRRVDDHPDRPELADLGLLAGRALPQVAT
jgi:hypothetical protein